MDDEIGESMELVEETIQLCCGLIGKFIDILKSTPDPVVTYTRCTNRLSRESSRGA